jgi:hypothetical protein
MIRKHISLALLLGLAVAPFMAQAEYDFVECNPSQTPQQLQDGSWTCVEAGQGESNIISPTGASMPGFYTPNA